MISYRQAFDAAMEAIRHREQHFRVTFVEGAARSAALAAAAQISTEAAITALVEVLDALEMPRVWSDPVV